MRIQEASHHAQASHQAAPHASHHELARKGRNCGVEHWIDLHCNGDPLRVIQRGGILDGPALTETVEGVRGLPKWVERAAPWNLPRRWKGGDGADVVPP